MRSIFDEDSSEAILMVDAKNAFNSLNRQTALRNIDISCPAMSHIFINTYRSGIELFVGGETLLSLEGTTQGDPLAMAMYAIASMPLIHHVSTTNANQAWYADDASAAGKLTALRQWWDKLESSGPAFGYVVNPSKTWLLVKPDLLEEGQIAFANTDVQVTTTGTRYLGSVLGTHSFIEEFVSVKATRWASEIKQLSEVAHTQPHAAYCAFTHGLRSEWNFLARTTPDITHLLQPLENVIQKSFLPALTGRNAPSTEERDLLALPARLGGLGITNPTTLEQEYAHSTLISRPLSDLIITQQTELGDAPLTQQQAKSTVRIERKKEQSANANETIGKLSDNLRRATELASEKGVSTWLTALPIAAHGFHLPKATFRDAICLRYGWTPQQLPSHCNCGVRFSISHALSCPKGGFPIIRHNELRDLCAELLTEVCPSVSIDLTYNL